MYMGLKEKKRGKEGKKKETVRGRDKLLSDFSLPTPSNLLKISEREEPSGKAHAD